MLDDGAVERRVRLIRPMEQPGDLLEDDGQKAIGREADRTASPQAWEAELAELPEFTDSTLHIVTGLLLPIWKRLPNKSTRVYRLQTDAGERIIGRLGLASLGGAGLRAQAHHPHAGRRFRGADGGPNASDLAEGLELRRVRVMGDVPYRAVRLHRGDGGSARADGLFGRSSPGSCACSCPLTPSGPACSPSVMERYPIERIAERAAA